MSEIVGPAGSINVGVFTLAYSGEGASPLCALLDWLLEDCAKTRGTPHNMQRAANQQKNDLEKLQTSMNRTLLQV
jgi:hypothetical protein